MAGSREIFPVSAVQARAHAEHHDPIEPVAGEWDELADYKLEWTGLVHERRALQAFAGSLAGVVEWAAFAYGRPVAKRVFALAGR